MATQPSRDIPQMPAGSIGEMAPAVQTGQPLDNRNLTRSFQDIVTLSVAHTAGNEQLGNAHQRYVEVVAQHIPGIAATPLGILTAIQNLQNSMNNRFNAVDGRLNVIDGRLNGLDVRFENMRSRMRNNNAWMNARSVSQVLWRIRKEKAGFGSHLSGAHAHLVLPDEAPAVGASIHDEPLTTEAVDVLNHSTIELLSRLLNDDFGILAGDNLNTRRTKYIEFTSY